MNYINNLIEMAKENTLLVSINKRMEIKKNHIKKNKIKYWKLSASERLHYDSTRERIDKYYTTPLFGLTIEFIKIFFYSTIFLMVIKLFIL